MSDDLKPSVWKAINEAVGDALGVPPPDPAQDRAPEGASPHGTSPAQMVPMADGEVVAQEKLEGNGVRFQNVSQEMADALEEAPPVPDATVLGPSNPLPPVPGVAYATAQDAMRVFLEEQQKRIAAELARENAKRLRQAMPAFHEDGSLLGEYAPMQGDAITPDTVDGLWWLGLPEKRAIWELGIDAKDYPRVHRDISIAAAVMINRRAQTGQYIPLIIKRKKRRLNSSLFAGGKWHNLRPVNPNDFPGMRDKP
jgi:hypothetical protein